MSDLIQIRERAVLRALFLSANVEKEDIRWRHHSIDPKTLAHRLKALSQKAIDTKALKKIVEGLGLCVLRNDGLKLEIQGFERSFDRQAIAEGMGSAGVQFFPTRQSANRAAYETAREAIYFGAGDFDKQFLDCPLTRILELLGDKKHQEHPKGLVLRDLRNGFRTQRSACEMLTEDRYFIHDAETPEKYIEFQKELRQKPIQGALEEKLKTFYNRRATIGIRDTIRWSLGSRHPWFGYKRAQELIAEAFTTHKNDNFNTAQVVYYVYDPSIDEADIASANDTNTRVTKAFALAFEQALTKDDPKLAQKLAPTLEELSAWVLDIHHDYPDFDLESQGKLGAKTHIEFLGHSIQNKVHEGILGESAQRRRNCNIRAHFEAQGINKKYLSKLSNEENENFFATLADVLRNYNQNGGILGINGLELYKRIPTLLFILQNLGKPNPAPNERLLDAFDLSRMTELEHASYMRAFPEISEKLVVFSTLTLRHMVDTEHVPDLRPRDFARDFLVLGLWGTRTPNIRINLYVDKSLDERDLAKTLTRAEIKFVGTEQVEIHPLEHLREEAKFLRFIASQLTPLIEPSLLRNLGTFTMAMEEFRSSNHVTNPDLFSIMHFGVDILREAAKHGIKGSINDTLSLFEFLLDSSLDGIQRKLDKTEINIKKMKKKKSKT